MLAACAFRSDRRADKNFAPLSRFHEKAAVVRADVATGRVPPAKHAGERRRPWRGVRGGTARRPPSPPAAAVVWSRGGDDGGGLSPCSHRW